MRKEIILYERGKKITRDLMKGYESSESRKRLRYESHKQREPGERQRVNRQPIREGKSQGVETVVSGHPKVPITIICPKWGGHRGQEAAEGIDVDFPQWCCLVEILHKSHA